MNITNYFAKDQASSWCYPIYLVSNTTHSSDEAFGWMDTQNPPKNGYFIPKLDIARKLLRGLRFGYILYTYVQRSLLHTCPVLLQQSFVFVTLVLATESFL